MRSLVFEGNTWAVCQEIRHKDMKLYNAFRQVLKAILIADPCAGIGKPEPLAQELTGLWSRRISMNDRIVYKCDRETVCIFSVGGQFNRLGE